jgi:hypothetical protein
MAVIIDYSKNGSKANHRIMTSTPTTITASPAFPIYSHEVGKDLIPELAMRVCSSYLDSFREAISNSFDENSKKVALSIQMTRLS